jgi:hypothetical protein
MIKGTLFAVMLSAAIAVPGLASAATAQQTLMKTCNADAKAKGLKGDERKSFMSTCLKGDAAAAPAAGVSDKQAAQREKMKTCNADAKAKALKGDERKAFMKSCLSG